MNLEIFDRIALCDDGKHKDRNLPIIGLSMHMFGVPGIHDAQGIAHFYRINTQYTGGQMPYTYVVQPGGAIEQALEIYDVGPHALRWSVPTISIVNIGDFNAHKPTPEQWRASVGLAAELSVAFDCEDKIKGHTERPGATRHVGKNCPGRYWDMNQFRVECWEHAAESAIQRLAGALMFE